VSTTPNEPERSEPESEPIQDAAPGASEQPRPGFTAPGGEQAQQQSPYQGQTAYQQQGQYGAAQYGDVQYGSAGPYQAAPPPPQYGQPYGYPGELPQGMPQLADWSQRATAFLLDNGVAIVAGWIAGGNVNNATDVAFGLVGLAGVVWAIVNAVRAGREGQSYGKRVMGIRLARLSDGQPIGGGLGFLRLFLNWIFWVACIVPGVLNLLWPLWDGRNQTWCDKIAKSVVVKTR
jgi:uncharacterized RDD family membrane protein YckC